ncbi:molybdopterin molybdotransferase MoeA [Flavobacterium phycosphaerae]|uniref:molybdopterin molybdotransferase MoeA n=1 Tax=Flavobacterium phycosphaerae TaxID=2697515 RepID=UPI00138B0D8D|nr:molybdopterin molybdotransferase MoeA [Flavobacterium phycosphaerae]
MISVNEAFSILNKITFSPKEKEVFLLESRNNILAETLLSPINMPPFRQSNMDGFALCLHNALEYEIIGEVKAGDENQQELKPGQALKIFTGAALPDSAQAVIQIEKVAVTGNQLHLQEQVIPETNVRPLGSQIKQNDEALAKGTFLNAAAIGFLAGLGYTKVKVYQKPTVSIVVTGNELVQPGQPLPYGKVYESNAIMLQTALYNAYYVEVKLYQVNDDFENTKAVLDKAISENEIVLVSGGISVGDYDFVGKALESLQVETLFYKVSQKPGKPLLVGKKDDKLVFALPGNPAASLTCFYIHVLPTLQRWSGMAISYESKSTRTLAHDFIVNNSRDQFLKATSMGRK